VNLRRPRDQLTVLCRPPLRVTPTRRQYPASAGPSVGVDRSSSSPSWPMAPSFDGRTVPEGAAAAAQRRRIASAGSSSQSSRALKTGSTICALGSGSNKLPSTTMQNAAIRGPASARTDFSASRRPGPFHRVPAQVRVARRIAASGCLSRPPRPHVDTSPHVAGEIRSPGGPHEGSNDADSSGSASRSSPEPLEHRGVARPAGPDGVYIRQRQIRPAHHPLEVEPTNACRSSVVLERRPSSVRQAVLLPPPWPASLATTPPAARCPLGEAPQGVRVGGVSCVRLVVRPTVSPACYVVASAYGCGPSMPWGSPPRSPMAPPRSAAMSSGHVADLSTWPGSVGLTSSPARAQDPRHGRDRVTGGGWLDVAACFFQSSGRNVLGSYDPRRHSDLDRDGSIPEGLCLRLRLIGLRKVKAVYLVDLDSSRRTISVEHRDGPRHDRSDAPLPPACVGLRRRTPERRHLGPMRSTR